MYIDSHAHLFMLVNEKGIQLSDIISEMKTHGVLAMTNICGNEKELDFSKSIVSEFKKEGIQLFSAAGFHPHEAESSIDSEVKWITENEGHILAVGEVGLDFHYDFSPRETQRKMLRKMIDISLDVQKPLIIHGRDGEEEILNLLLEYGLKDKKVLFHCYTGPLYTASKIFENGWNISFSGIVTFKKSIEMSLILKSAPLDQVFFETDSPFLSPTPFRGQVNTPAKVKYVYDFASELLQINSRDLKNRVKNNFETFFNVKTSL